MMQCWNKFCLLLWKNWKLKLRKPIRTLISISLPILVIAAILLLRTNEESQDIRGIVYPSVHIPVIYSTFGYSPNTTHFVQDVIKSIGGIGIGLPIAKQLEDWLVKNKNQFYDGIQFNDDVGQSLTPQTNLTITLRLPNSDFPKGGSLYPEDLEIFPYYSFSGYQDTSFPSFMYYLTKSLLKNKDPSVTIPSMRTRMFPLKGYERDSFIDTCYQSSLLSIMVTAGFVFTFTSLVRAVTLEKERQLKESMKIMGLPTWLHWTAWFVEMFIMMLIIDIFLTVVMKFETSNGKVLNYMDWKIFFIFIVLISIQIITLAFAVSVFFSKANRASQVAGIIWLLSMLPFFLVRTSSTLSPTIKYLFCLFGASPIFYGFDIIIIFEAEIKAFRGVQWDNLFETTEAVNMSFGGVLLMVILDIFLYMMITLYIEQVFPGNFGVPQKWYFFLTTEFWCPKPTKDDTQYKPISNQYFEEEPASLQAGIRIINLKKKFGPNEVVKGLSLNLYQDQITVLLGHNGAGKTTTMSMLTGMIPPSGGTAKVNGFDVKTQIMNVRDSMGLCPQHNVLFDDLTVREHLYFFSKLKGCTGSEVEKEIETFLKLLNLEDKANEKPNALSGGMKRRLCVGVALCGKSKVIMLDEPTAGMDPSARRFIWEFLQKMKKGRTILLTTHFMDEADLLGDRIAIMSDGVLKCCGSSFFLKKNFGTGYQLIIDQLPSCHPNRITQLLGEYIENIKIQTIAGTELVYLLPEKYVSVFPELLSRIENSLEYLGIRSFGISLTALEEVFMKVGSNAVVKKLAQRDDNQYTQVTMNSVPLHTGRSLHLNQIRAIFLKKALSLLRTWKIMLITTGISVIYLVFMILTSSTSHTSESSNTDTFYRRFTLDDYPDSVVLIQRPKENSGTGYNDYKGYKNMLQKMNKKFEETDDIITKVFNVSKENPESLRTKYILGASFDTAPTAWYSTVPNHALPLSLKLLMDSFHPDLKIDFINHPFQATDDEIDYDSSSEPSTNANVALSAGVVLIGTFYIIFCIRERACQAKHLQFVSGVNVFIFWFVAFLSDYISYLIQMAAIVATCAIMQLKIPLDTLVVLLMLYGIALIPFLYMASNFFKVSSAGYALLFFVGFVAGFPAVLIMFVLRQTDSSYQFLKWFFSFVPHYDFSDGVLKLNIAQSKNEILHVFTGDTFSFTNDRLGFPVLFSVVIALISYMVIFAIDLRLLATWTYKLFLRNGEPIKPDFVDDDVEKENTKVHSTPLDKLQSEYILTLKDLSKTYKNFRAVNGLNLTVQQYECFGLLGVNGAGKTTTFKMMTGDVLITYGDGWINHFSVKNQMKKVHKFIGYCPQFDALLDNLTARETLNIFSLIRGVPKDECEYLAAKLAGDFDFSEHLDKKVRELSGGNKRKLSTAIALVGDAPILFLDEPTTGMDPASKRHLWNQLSKLRASGKSIILTSHSMEECEALCTRLAIMVNGNFQCLGSVQHLKNKFAEGFSVTLKVRKPENSSGLDHGDTTEIENFMKQHFPNSELREKHQELLSYYIKSRSVQWSWLFGILERAKHELNIEDYSVGQSNLEQIFLIFTRQQKTDFDTEKKKTCFGLC